MSSYLKAIEKVFFFSINAYLHQNIHRTELLFRTVSENRTHIYPKLSPHMSLS